MVTFSVPVLGGTGVVGRVGALFLPLKGLPASPVLGGWLMAFPLFSTPLVLVLGGTGVLGRVDALCLVRGALPLVVKPGTVFGGAVWPFAACGRGVAEREVAWELVPDWFFLFLAFFFLGLALGAPGSAFCWLGGGFGGEVWKPGGLGGDPWKPTWLGGDPWVPDGFGGEPWNPEGGAWYGPFQ